MASKSKKKKAPKRSRGSKVTPMRAGIGHNGKINKPLQKLFNDYAAMDADKKQISKAQRDIRARAKEEHGVDKEVFGHEVKLQKMASDRRAMFETGHASLKDMIGIQLALELPEDGQGEESGDDELEDGDQDAA